MRCEAMAQGMWMYIFLDTRSLCGVVARMPNHFGGDRLIATVVAVAWKQPNTWLSLQPMPVLAELFEEFWTEHHVPIFATLTSSDVNHHALAVDIRDF